MGEMTCSCPKGSNPAILDKALEEFDRRHEITGDPLYEFAFEGGPIQDSDDDGMWEVDCSHLVHWAVNAAVSSSNECKRQVPYMTTKYFVPPALNPVEWIKYLAHRVHERNKYYCEITDLNDVGPGDIIVLDVGSMTHMGIVQSREQYPGGYEGAMKGNIIAPPPLSITFQV